MPMPPAVRARYEELNKLGLTQDGKLELEAIYKRVHGMPPGAMLPAGTSLVIGILDKEFPRDEP